MATSGSGENSIITFGSMARPPNVHSHRPAKPEMRWPILQAMVVIGPASNGLIEVSRSITHSPAP